ncbi:MAG: SUMF1/EgtB/PvdO family nonheme iron enzyme [Deltaproteobacteria bacterium]|nr:SUMF1/EgtB/PvdO family nonheme iron enzyme [Deltaproteobacteria bacterium]
MIVFSKDTLRVSVEAATGGKVTVLYDDKGYPSYMRVIPKFNVEDIDASLGTGVHPAFIVAGVEKSEIFLGQYPAHVQDGRALSLPGVDPTVSVDYDTAKGYCTAKGAGWHMLTNWEWAALELWCLKNGFQPRGNTYYGRHHDQVHEQGVRQDGVAPGTASGSARTLTGSGPASWRHDNTLAGISDITGNIWKWVDGMKLVGGKFYMPNDNDFNLAEENWVDQGVIIADDAGVTKIGDAALDAVHATGDISFGAWKGLTTTANYDALAAATRERMFQACIDPYNVTDPVGNFWFNTDGERVPLRGGHWFNAGGAGPGAL